MRGGNCRTQNDPQECALQSLSEGMLRKANLPQRLVGIPSTGENRTVLEMESRHCRIRYQWYPNNP